jgi:AraC family transcriptional regulator, transcriptional activator of pobA
VATAAAALREIPSFFLYGEAPRDDGEPTLHIEPIGFRSARHHWQINPHVHRTLHQLIFVLRGRGVSLAESAAVEYSPPALIIVPAGTVHGFRFDPGTHGYVLSMTDDLPRAIAQRSRCVAALFERSATIELDADDLEATDLARSLKMLTREFARSLPGRSLALTGLLDVILANVLRLVQPSLGSGEVVVSRDRWLVTRFRDLIETGFREGRPLVDYAAALKVSESRLRHACMIVAAQSPMQLVHARVVLEAKRQLRYTSGSVSEIAYALGFDDPAYFTRFFSRRTGISPRAFRALAPRPDESGD